MSTSLRLAALLLLCLSLTACSELTPNERTAIKIGAAVVIASAIVASGHSRTLSGCEQYYRSQHLDPVINCR
jgi:hypothetical protein